ncbi:hypothetical protein [Mycolicibacterium komossense]|uniref:Uncharacterized protein n=1 Tax=Mycolicibacterium komossense TaxID=1779 RepID=A0ABT3CCI2_9MYCO|nr:hypothetical protein [Mycolicibacterium komossense]MCV7227127.1 hypothetical protein [Mycolicibacterium komossense]
MTSVITLQEVLPTSADPRVASENFAAEQLVAIVTMTGRSIAQLARHPDEREIALLPGTILQPVGSVAVDGLAKPVALLAEPGDAPRLPENSTALREAVRAQVANALTLLPVVVHSPGRFTPPQ